VGNVSAPKRLPRNSRSRLKLSLRREPSWIAGKTILSWSTDFKRENFKKDLRESAKSVDETSPYSQPLRFTWLAAFASIP